ncbi:hypothetical protein [Thermanaerovibrio acidaminovorans]|uniref:Ferric oxidoreductase domain-containing protein n=1 Tax=Thermanaerovibrio acidaminovorans (strain ATCC 49978 / DSM 6589 / Su883) TaxID=525903 RepID=D1B847_THEAS|nr:hypothetical protein [Thermanaerovibrio acidaminovorans]ACZ18450.1 hypothetical protein Taci_0211 [Thermanaerovibrio acidaminovorans DSM 6589]
MYLLFRLSGLLALLGLLGAAVTGLGGAILRRLVDPRRILRLHRALGILGVIGGLVHGAIYWTQFR